MKEGGLVKEEERSMGAEAKTGQRPDFYPIGTKIEMDAVAYKPLA